MEIGVAAVTDPACDGEHELDAGLVTLLDQIQVVFPVVIPAFSHSRYRHAARAVRRKRAELESVAGELVSVIEGDDIAAVRDRTDVLGQASLTFAERRMDRSIKSALSGVAVAELEASE